jgi:hypothetical protein
MDGNSPALVFCSTRGGACQAPRSVYAHAHCPVSAGETALGSLCSPSRRENGKAGRRSVSLCFFAEGKARTLRLHHAAAGPFSSQTSGKIHVISGQDTRAMIKIETTLRSHLRRLAFGWWTPGPISPSRRRCPLARPGLASGIEPPGRDVGLAESGCRLFAPSSLRSFRQAGQKNRCMVLIYGEHKLSRILILKYIINELSKRSAGTRPRLQGAL